VTFHNRHECKFVVPEAVAAKVLQRVGPFVEPDPNARALPNHTYSIASLYLDTPDDALRHETIDGRADRFKLRIRSYGDGQGDRLYFEIKSRRDRVVLKQRCPIPREQLAAVLRGDLTSLPTLPSIARSALHEFVRRMLMRAATPRCIVRYRRQAYMGRGDHEVRVTVDRELSVLPTRDALLRLDHPAYQPVPVDGVVLELKFTDRSPGWLTETVRALGLRRRSFSKYATCIASLLPGYGSAAS
jgi:hypothetical protein